MSVGNQPNKCSLSELGLLSKIPEQEYDRITELASEMLAAPVSLVSIIDRANDRQVFKSQTGLGQPWSTKAETPLSHSFCQHVVNHNCCLSTSDARTHEIFHDNLAIDALNVTAYLGVPIHTPDGSAVGALCAISPVPRQWTSQAKSQLEKLASCVDDLIRLRMMNIQNKHLRLEMQDITVALSHDMKSPICSLEMLHQELRLSLGKEASQDQIQLLEHCKTATENTQSHINNIQRFTHLFDDVDLTEKVDLTVLIRQVIDFFKAEIESSSAQLDIADELPVVRGNYLQLFALFQALFSNALKFTMAGVPPIVRLHSLQTCNQKEKTVLLCLKDNGIGIPEEHHEKVFKLFDRLHLRSSYVGDGIGLALCKRIVRNHSGNISIRSDGQKGTEIMLELPLRQV